MNAGVTTTTERGSEAGCNINHKTKGGEKRYSAVYRATRDKAQASYMLSLL
jgi:hypothetical protein